MAQIHSYVQRLLGLTRTESGDALVIDPYSIGDVFQTLTLMDHFKRVHGVRRLQFMCRGRAARVICLFDSVDGVHLLDNFDEEKLSLLAQTHWYASQKTIFIAPPEMHMDGLRQMDCSRGENLMKLKKQILGLPEDLRPILPSPREKIVEAAYQSATSQGLKRGAVIVFNHAYTMKPMNPEVFRPLTDFFPEGVFFDDWSGAPNGWGQRLHIPLEQVPYFCDFAGNAISIRSGITELLSASKAAVHTIYPGSSWMADWFKNKDEAAEMFRTWGIQDLGLNSSSREKKIFIEDGDCPSVIAAKIQRSVASM